MSEQSLGDISGHKQHQFFEVLQASGFSVGLFHRLRLDKEYREAFIAQAQQLDKEMIGGKMWILEYDPDFCHPLTIVKALKERSPYSNRHSYLLKDEILLALWEADPASRRPLQFPIHLYAMPLYKRMTEEEVREELKRRNLVLAGATEALCLATWLAIGRGYGAIIVPGAVYRNSVLCFDRNGDGDPMLCLTPRDNMGIQLLVKRKPA